ncbi:MAG: hypothetical protein R2818_01620 [Flavobacteriales bacterium]
MKVWEDHAYITTEANGGGITIVDLSPLPQSTALTATVFFDPAWETSHALFIDENGRLFIFGAGEGNGGAIMYDLAQDPMAPVRVGEYDPLYIHDGYARGDTLYAGHILNGFFSIVDVSDPAAPVLLGTQITPNAFTHNVWLDDSGDHLFTTDERTNAYVGSYDVSDPGDIQFLDKLQSDFPARAPFRTTPIGCRASTWCRATTPTGLRYMTFPDRTIWSRWGISTLHPRQEEVSSVRGVCIHTSARDTDHFGHRRRPVRVGSYICARLLVGRERA